jgi:glycosyltransferase involved in cell wall biosynthesis
MKVIYFEDSLPLITDVDARTYFNLDEEIQGNGFDNIEIWQRSIDIKLFSTKKRNHYFRKMIAPKSEQILLYAGRLAKEEDLDVLIKVNNSLKERNIKFKQVIAGDGPFRETLESELPDAYFTAFIYGEKLAEIFASSDIFVFPSTSESFDNFILEAYASGLPVIGVDQGGAADLIKDGRTGFIARAKNPHDISMKIIYLINHSAVQKIYAQNALAYAGQYTWGNINTRLSAGYQKNVNSSSHINTHGLSPSTKHVRMCPDYSGKVFPTGTALPQLFLTHP